jgi:ATP-binding protein involved in chromosome partitioning
VCPKCGEQHDIFGHGGARQEAEKLGVPFLGGIPLHIDIRARSDSGMPIVSAEPDSIHAKTFCELASKAWAEIEAASVVRSKPPKLEPSPKGDALRVTFDNAKPFELSAEMLRVMSPSAEVQGHSPAQRVTVGNKCNVRIKALQPVGNYAVRIVFDDGHDTGLFTWTYLQQLDRERDKRWAEYLDELRKKGLGRG